MTIDFLNLLLKLQTPFSQQFIEKWEKINFCLSLCLSASLRLGKASAESASVFSVFYSMILEDDPNYLVFASFLFCILISQAYCLVLLISIYFCCDSLFQFNQVKHHYTPYVIRQQHQFTKVTYLKQFWSVKVIYDFTFKYLEEQNSTCQPFQLSSQTEQLLYVFSKFHLFLRTAFIFLCLNQQPLARCYLFWIQHLLGISMLEYFITSFLFRFYYSFFRQLNKNSFNSASLLFLSISSFFYAFEKSFAVFDRNYQPLFGYYIFIFLFVTAFSGRITMSYWNNKGFLSIYWISSTLHAFNSKLFLLQKSKPFGLFAKLGCVLAIMILF